MNTKVAIIGAALASVALSACATVTRGTNQDYVIDSYPQGALVTLSNGMSCETPCELHLKRKHAFSATFEMAGYEPATVDVETKFSGGGGAAGAGNILLGGFIGAGVDASNGSLNNLMPHPLIVRLAEEGSGEEAFLLEKDGAERMSVANHNLKVAENRGGEQVAEATEEGGNGAE